VDGTSKGNYAVLTNQAVMLDSSTINLNTSFRDVLARDQAVTTSCYEFIQENSQSKQRFQYFYQACIIQAPPPPLISSFSDFFGGRYD